MKKQQTILIIEDESRILRMLGDLLKSCGYEILEADNGSIGTELFFSNNSRISLILLDVMMPEKDGYEVLREIRQVSEVPVIMLTAKSEEYDQLSSFKHGADDFMTKPFSPSILLAHIEAVLKRCSKTDERRIKLGQIEIDSYKMELLVDGIPTELTPKEYDLLTYFGNNQNIVLTRDAILNSVWGYNYEGDLRTIDTHVKQLRSKLSCCSSYIRTVHGVGYRFEVADE